MNPTRPTPGAISLSNYGHLLPKVGSLAVNPVIVPPVRARLATKPLPIGSETLTKIIGMVRLSCEIAATPGVVSTTITSGCCSTTVQTWSRAIASTAKRP